MKLPGFRAVKWKTKKGEGVAYYYRAPLAQGRKQTPLGTDYQKALKKYADLIGLELEPESNTLAYIHAQYMQWANSPACMLAERTIKNQIEYWGKPKSGRLCTAFAEVRPEDFLTVWGLEYFENRSSQKQAKKELKYLQRLFNWGRARGLVRCPNPFDGVMRQLKVDTGRDIYVEDTWYRLVHKHGTQFVRDVMDFTYIAGNRPNETRRALFSGIKGDELEILLSKTTKSGLKKKRLKIEGALLDYIDRQRKRAVSSIYLVSDERGQPFNRVGSKFRNEWDRARDKAQAKAKKKGIDFERFQLMDLRAKAATDTYEKHGLEAARRLLGHTTQKQTADYIRNIKGVSATALEKLGK